MISKGIDDVILKREEQKERREKERKREREMSEVNDEGNVCSEIAVEMTCDGCASTVRTAVGEIQVRKERMRNQILIGYLFEILFESYFSQSFSFEFIYTFPFKRALNHLTLM